MDFNAILKNYSDRIDQGFEKWVPAAKTRPATLHSAMRYSLLAPSKRLRPMLVLAVHEMYPSSVDPVPAAVAIECLHTYSLIHDDLPCMDNGFMRRGQETLHLAFDEATALLAGDALLTLAFEIIARGYAHHSTIGLQLTQILAHAAGSQRLIGGQQVDVEASTDADIEPSVQLLEYIHANKTAALISAAFQMGAVISDIDEDSQKKFETIGQHLGMAFQIVDDILDLTSDEMTLGKSAQIDEANNKLTYPGLFGLEQAGKRADEHTQKALELLHELRSSHTFIAELVRTLQARAA